MVINFSTSVLNYLNFVDSAAAMAALAMAALAMAALAKACERRSERWQRLRWQLMACLAMARRELPFWFDLVSSSAPCRFCLGSI